MVHLLKIVVAFLIFLVPIDALSSPPIYGPLMVQNNFSEITANGTQSTAEINLFGYTISLGGNFSTSGSNSLTFTTTGTTNLTLPTSGTLLTTAGAAGIYAPIASPTFTGTVTIPSGSVLNTPTSLNLTNAIGLPYSALPSLSSNQILGSLTATTPSGQSVPSCSSSTDALQWTSGIGFGCNSSINAATLGGATFASPGAIGGTTASSGKFTTIQATSTITPSTTSGIVGTTLGDNANAGSDGEYISNSVTSFSMTSGSIVNISSVSLTSGDWDCRGQVQTLPAASTTTTNLSIGISTSSGAFGSVASGSGYAQLQDLLGANLSQTVPIMDTRELISTTTTVYLVASVTFATSTMATNGYISCRRVR